MNTEDKKKSQLYKQYAEEEGKKKEEERIGFAHSFAERAKRSAEDFIEGMGEEYNETIEMSQFFFKLLEEKLQLRERETPPSKEEVKKAIEQLKDMGRVGIFASVSILPGGGLSLLGLEILARKFGIKNFTFIPSSFRKRLYKESYKKNKEGDGQEELNHPRGN
ncbi:MAG: hypothetical protein K9H65_04205 [Bacteroidales bacterium]|nr:hypothetical protein [Bacteroidales bacterium]